MKIYLVYFTNNAKYREDDETHVTEIFLSNESAEKHIEEMRKKRDESYDEDSPSYGEFDCSDDWFIREWDAKP
jgi:hypothetical protein